MNNKMVEKDERTTSIENASYSYGYKFLTFALLLDVMYRSFRFNEAPWDLLAIVITSGFAMTIYQYKQKILGKSWIKIAVLTMGVAIVSAAVVALITMINKL
jgi:hypothetical protein